MKQILVVDDNKANLILAKKALEDNYQVILVKSGMQALQVLEKQIPDLILLDINMPEMSGIETMMKMREREELKDIPVVFLTADGESETEVVCLKLGASDFIMKPFVKPIMLCRIERILELAELKKKLEIKVVEKERQVGELSLQTMRTMMNVIDDKDPYNKNHSIEVANIAKLIARRLHWSEEEIYQLDCMALLHDVGRLGIPDEIINKEGTLTVEEFQTIQKHTGLGNEILKDIVTIDNIADGAKYHHERYDGTGYPDRLAKDEIPIAARIIAVADAYQAMCYDRPYRPKLDKEAIKAELLKESGKQFDPQIVEILLSLMEEEGALEFHEPVMDSEEAKVNLESHHVLKRVLSQYKNSIETEARRDEMTKCWNRNYLEEVVNESMKANPNKGALFMMDLDNFKLINDNYGHMKGDSIILQFAEILRTVCRKEDILARVGGDEFCIFFSDIEDVLEARRKAKNILAEVNNAFTELDVAHKFGTSIGIAMVEAAVADFKELYNRADKALYSVKRKQKHNFECYFDYGCGKVEEPVTFDRVTKITDIEEILGEQDEPKGVFQVTIDEFENIYQFLKRNCNRSEAKVQILCITLEQKENEEVTDAVIETRMTQLNQAISQSLRKGDVCTRFSSCQYVVIIMGARSENCQLIMERIREGFYSMNQDRDIALKYLCKEVEL